MKELLFVDHEMHKTTRSSEFFIELLKPHFVVNVFYLTPRGPIDDDVLVVAERAAVVIVWQMDFLAPVFLSMGLPTVVIPMFDGSINQPDLHWICASRARFLNFSLTLHERIRLLGCRSKLFKYFPAPVAKEKIVHFDKLSAFLWQRRPEDNITVEYVDGLIGMELDAFHCHNVPDNPDAPTARGNVFNSNGGTYTLTMSSWFSSKKDYICELERHNVFIAPRPSEGIGMATLEAMARGMLVLAHDEPTNNEYVCNWVNGILFNKDVTPVSLHVKTAAKRIGYAAWATVKDGHRQWQAVEPDIVNWIAETPPGPSTALDRNIFLRDLWKAFYASPEAYHRFLRQHLAQIISISGRTREELISTIGDRQRPALLQVSQCGDYLIDGEVLDVAIKDKRFLGTGWYTAEHDWCWAGGLRASLMFKLNEVPIENVDIEFEARSLPELGESIGLTIFLNDTVVYDSALTPFFVKYHFTVPPDRLRASNNMVLNMEAAGFTINDQRSLSAAFKKFELRRTSQSLFE